MSRQIDADRLKKHYAWWRITDSGRDMADLFDEIVDAQPTADVVEVVRCENCKWWDNEDNGPFGYCHAAKHCHYSRHWEIQIYRKTEPDFFCKDGEQKEGTDTP